MPMPEWNSRNAQKMWLRFIMSVLHWRKRSRRRHWMMHPEAENSLWQSLNRGRSQMPVYSPARMRN